MCICIFVITLTLEKKHHENFSWIASIPLDTNVWRIVFLRLRVLPSRDFPNLHQFPGSQRAWHAAQRLVMIYIKYESSNMILSLGKPAQHKALFITFQLFSLPWVTVVYYTIKSCTFRAFQIKPYCTRFLSKSFLFHEGRNLRLQSSLWKREKESGGRDPDPDKKLGTHLYLYLSMQPQPWKWI